MRSGIGWQQWRDMHWKWIPGRAALARNDRGRNPPGFNKSHAGLRPGIQTSLNALRYGISGTPLGQITRLCGVVWELMRGFLAEV